MGVKFALLSGIEPGGRGGKKRAQNLRKSPGHRPGVQVSQGFPVVSYRRKGHLCRDTWDTLPSRGFPET